MVRGIFFLSLFLSPLVAQAATITHAGMNSNKFCYGYFDGTSKWCWLTYKGHEDYAADGEQGWHCKDWDGYATDDYCEGAQDKHEDPVEHKADHHDSGDHEAAESGAADGGLGYYNGWGVQWIVDKHCDAEFGDLAKLVCKFYGTSHYGWGGDGTYSTVKCNGKSVKFKKGSSCWEIHGSIPSGGAPKPMPPRDPSELQSFIANWIPNQLGKKVQRIGETRPDRLECWDLAARAVDEANLAGFNLGIGERGGEVHWIWSDKVIPPKQAKAGDIAQFSSYRQSRGHSSASTGWRHTGVVEKDFDSDDCSIDVYDQNPTPVHKTTYYPPGCPGHDGGEMVIYRLVSKAGSPWGRLYSVDGMQLDEEPSLVRTPMAMLMTGATAAMAVFGFVACRTYFRSKSGSTRAMYVMADEEEQVEEGVE